MNFRLSAFFELPLYGVLGSTLVSHDGLEAAVATRSRSPAFYEQ
jgi:hypothetical protein